jgi:hypothetical protein
MGPVGAACVESKFHRAAIRQTEPVNSSMPDTELGQVSEEAEYSQKPNNHGNHDNSIQDAFDLALHRYVAVNQPE